MTLLGFKRSLFFTIKDKNANEKVTEKEKLNLILVEILKLF